jgi:exopolysaccharide production protein ExoZ
MLKSVQLLRFVAAAMVLGAHLPPWAWNLPFSNPLECSPAHGICGSIGVDVFFCISGFLMLVTTDSKPHGIRSTLGFVVRRFFRIWPLYALVTYIVATGFRGQWVSGYLNSLMFMPYLSPTGFWDPAILSGWTLNFEMYFYLLTALCLLTPWKTRLAACIALALGLFSLTIDNTVYYIASIVVEFALGALLGVLWSNRDVWRKLVAVRWPLLLASACLFVVAGHASDWVPPFGMSVLRMDVRLFYFDAVLPRFIGWGVPAFFLMLSVMLFEDSIPEWLSHLGDYTYSVYLLHVPIVQGADYLEKALPDATVRAAVNLQLVPLGIVVATAVGALITYHLIEVPMIRLGSALARIVERAKPANRLHAPPSA